jgi:hypothetical protein
LKVLATALMDPVRIFRGGRPSGRSTRFTKTNLNAFQGTDSVQDGAREIVRVALLGRAAPTGKFTRWEGEIIPW